MAQKCKKFVLKTLAMYKLQKLVYAKRSQKNAIAVTTIDIYLHRDSRISMATVGCKADTLLEQCQHN